MRNGEIQVAGSVRAVEIEMGRVGADFYCLAVLHEFDDTQPAVAAVGLELRVKEHLVDVNARVVRVDAVAGSVAAEVAIERHFEVAVHFYQLVPHVDAIISLDVGIVLAPTCVARANE